MHEKGRPELGMAGSLTAIESDDFHEKEKQVLSSNIFLIYIKNSSWKMT